MSAVMSNLGYEMGVLTAEPEARSLTAERDFLKACVRAEFEAARRGQSSILIVDALCKRLDEVEARLVRELVAA